MQLISKCGIQHPSDNSSYQIKHYDYSAKEIKRSVEQSLKNLQTDYLDVLLFHRPSPLMPLDEVLEALTQLFDAGKVLSFGLSNFEPAKTVLIQSVVPVAYNQIEFSLTHHTPLTDGQLDFMQLNQIQPMAYKPLGDIFKGDMLAKGALIEVLTAMSVKYECAVDVLLLAWILMHPTHILPVIGTTSMERIINQKGALSIKLSLEDWFEMYVASMGHQVA